MDAARKKVNQRAGVLICGAYGMHNLGDDAVLGALLAELRSIDPDMPITVLSRSPEETAREHNVAALHMFNVPGFLKAMGECRLYVNGGGSLIQDVTSTRSLLYYLFTLWAAKRRGCRVMMYGCGIGPVNRPGNRRLAGRIIDRNVDAITLRGSRSREALAEFHVTRPEILVTSDPALFLKSAPAPEIDRAMEQMGLEPHGRYFGFCVRRWPGMEEKAPLFAAAADYAYEKYGMHPVLLTVNSDQDEPITARVRALVRAPCAQASGQIPLETMIGVISRMSGVVAMRLHALIFAASQAVPLAAVSYDPKVASFLDDLSQSNYLDYATLHTAEALFALVDAVACADRDALRAATGRVMEMESRNVETARRLLESGA